MQSIFDRSRPEDSGRIPHARDLKKVHTSLHIDYRDFALKQYFAGNTAGEDRRVQSTLVAKVGVEPTRTVKYARF